MSDEPWRFDRTGHDAPLGEYHDADQPRGGSRVKITYTKGEGHRLVIGPTGAGKFWAVIAPLLLTADHASAIVFDVASGEAARETGPWRATLGPVLILDPYSLAGGTGALNPVDALGEDDGGMLSRAQAVAEAVMMTTKTGGNADYWNGQARDLLMALLIHVRTWPEEQDRTLARIRQLVRGPVHDAFDKKTRKLIREGFGLAAMHRNQAAGGYVADAATNIGEDLDLTGGQNFFYVRQTLRDNTSWLDAPEIKRVTATTTLDLRVLRERIATLYVVAPSRELRALGRWLRLVYATVLPVMLAPVDAERHADRTGVPLHMIMDEFAAFGAFERVTDDMATVRKYGLSYTLAVQKLSQLKGLYRQSWETFIPKYLHILGSDELTTSDYVSKRIGNTEREAHGSSITRQSGGGSRGENTSYYSAPLLEPQEIAGMDPARCLAIVQGSKDPLLLRKWWAFEAPELKARLPAPDGSMRGL